MVRITLQERSDRIRQKLDAGYKLPAPELLANDGLRRTARKRTLLRTVRDAAAAQGQTPPFKANF